MASAPVRPVLHYDVHPAGPGAATILLVHGMLSSRAQWLPNLPALTQRHRCVVVELLGHGRSPSPEEPNAYTPAAYIAQFEAIREALGLERWYVIGQSLGAALTLNYALAHPQRVVAQAFTNSNSALAPPGWEARARPFLERQATEFEKRGRAAIDDHPLNPARTRWLDPAVRDALAADVRLHSPHGLAMTGLHTTLSSSVYERASRIATPTLLVVGEREERFAASRRYAEDTFPDLEVVGADAGHAVNLGAAAAFNAAVLDFFARRGG